MKDRKKFLIISIIAAVILILIVVAALFFLTDIFKNNKEIFNKYLAQSGSQLVDQSFIKTYINANIREFSESNSTFTDTNLYSTSMTEENATKLAELAITSLKDTNLKQDYKIFKISDGTRQLAAIKYVKDGNIIGLGADNVLTKYITIDSTNIKQFAERLGITNTTLLPSLINEIDYNKLLAVNEETYSNLKQKYISIILNNIETDKYSKVKNEDKTESLILTLTNQDIANICEKVLEEAKNDDTLLNLIKEKANDIGYVIETTDIKSKIDETLSKLADLQISEGETRISLIIKDKKVIKYIIETPKINYGEYELDETTIEIDCESSNTIVINVESENQKLKIYINYAYNENVINLEMKAYSIEDGQEKQITYLKNEMLNYSTDKIINTTKIDTVLGNENYELDIKKETNFKQDIQIEKLTTENSARIDLMTDEGLQQLIVNLLQRIQTLYGEQMNNLLNLQMM